MLRRDLRGIAMGVVDPRSPPEKLARMRMYTVQYRMRRKIDYKDDFSKDWIVVCSVCGSEIDFGVPISCCPIQKGEMISDVYDGKRWVCGNCNTEREV